MALDPTLLETCLAILVIGRYISAYMHFFPFTEPALSWSVANTASVAAEGLFSVRR